MRNAAVTTVAPTGTISIIADCSPGIEPLYGVSFTRNVMEDLRLVTLHPLFVELARAAGIYSGRLARRVASQVSIRNIREIPEFRQLEMGISTSMYLPASGTAGLQRFLVSG